MECSDWIILGLINNFRINSLQKWINFSTKRHFSGTKIQFPHQSHPWNYSPFFTPRKRGQEPFFGKSKLRTGHKHIGQYLRIMLTSVRHPSFRRGKNGHGRAVSMIPCLIRQWKLRGPNIRLTRPRKDKQAEQTYNSNVKVSIKFRTQVRDLPAITLRKSCRVFAPKVRNFRNKIFDILYHRN